MKSYRETENSLYELIRGDYAIRRDREINLIYQTLDDEDKKWLGSNIPDYEKDIDNYYD